MFQLIIPAIEKWDETNENFIVSKEQVIQIEHSLVSISKWESKWCKPFLSKDSKTIEETTDYIRCMTITQNINPEVYNNVTNDNIKEVSKYIEASMSATWFRKDKNAVSKEIITSEIIYYWMITYNIPFECQKWHLNRLLTLITVCNKKNEKPKKMSNAEIMSRNTELNNERRKKSNSKG